MKSISLMPDSAAPLVIEAGATRPGLKRLAGRALRIPAALLLSLLWIYRHTLSPALPVVTLGACGCRFAPTCSEYAMQAIRVHGALLGAWLAVKRLVKCTPLHPGGYDPVPPRMAPVCREVRRREPHSEPAPGGPSLILNR